MSSVQMLIVFHVSCCFITYLLFHRNSLLHQVSPNNKLVAYAEDTKGDEIYTVYVIDAESGMLVGKPLVGAITSYLAWAGDEALVYVTMDEILRSDKVWISLELLDISDLVSFSSIHFPTFDWFLIMILFLFHNCYSVWFNVLS